MKPTTTLDSRFGQPRSLIASGFAALREPRVGSLRLLCALIIACAIFCGPLDIAEGVGADLDARLAKTPSILLKLATAGAAALVGAWGVLCVARVRALLFSFPGIVLLTIALLFIASCVTSVTSASLPIAIVFFGYLMFIPTAIVILDLRGVVAAALIGALLYTLGAMFLYVFVPRFGVFPEDMGDGVVVNRLGGMSQPNHTGRVALIGFLLVAYFMRLPRAPRWICVVLIGFFLLAGSLALSRTAILAAIICLAILNLDLVQTPAGLAVTFLVSILGIGLLFSLAALGYEDYLAQKLLGAVTKTGDIQEVTEVTGRAEIWERTIKLIKGRPLQGYGMGSAKIMLVDHLQSTHNILLHPTLSAGVFAGGLTLCLLLWNLVNVFTYPQLLIRALSAYFIISGFTEDTIYETFPGACTLLWMFCCLWPSYRPMSEAKSQSVTEPRDISANYRLALPR